VPRLVAVLLIFLALPVPGQDAASERMSQMVWSRGQMMRSDSPPDLDLRAARLEAIHHDAADLSTLSASVQSDLQQLQKGLLAKDLDQKLKKMEKLAKRLRQEMTP
jgi:hypothetical protein